MAGYPYDCLLIKNVTLKGDSNEKLGWSEGGECLEVV